MVKISKLKEFRIICINITVSFNFAEKEMIDNQIKGS